MNAYTTLPAAILVALVYLAAGSTSITMAIIVGLIGGFVTLPMLSFVMSLVVSVMRKQVAAA